jgi:hypothetical protein
MYNEALIGTCLEQMFTVKGVSVMCIGLVVTDFKLLIMPVTTFQISL